MQPSTTEARYEFRIFGQDFAHWHKRMARLSEPVPEQFWSRQSSETYLLSTMDQQHNVKLRKDMLDIKTRLKQEQGLEQWSVMSKTPLSDGKVQILPLLQQAFACPDLTLADNLDEAELIKGINAHPTLQAVRVSKVRAGYRIGSCLCEYAQVLINDAMVYSLAVESGEPEHIREVIRRIGLPDTDNISYPEAIRRILGWHYDRLVFGED